MLTDLWVILVWRCDRQEEKACGGQVSDLCFQGPKGLLGERGQRGLPSLVSSPAGRAQPLHVLTASLAQLDQDVALQEDKCWPEGVQIME